ncbi:sensor histidine kinase [Kitasatospora purpeofusca]|uniref:sensor histidine kinase n=1 Tax=Kitasatospora purpeofusca TaxID=67352 RepID=UPI002A5AC386|nr:sensor domain-containing protein [Kitasatospora purpeofusca]MDY0812159.1 sensor domain-containing protein [Kitasatospora purpeofusca]
MTSASETARPARRPHRGPTAPDLWRAGAHLATDGLAALAGLAVLLTLVTGVCLLPVALTGLPVILLAGRALHLLAAAERARHAATGGPDLPAPPLPGLSAAAPLRSARTLATDRGTRRQAGYFLALLPLSVLTNGGAVLAWAVPLTLLALPAYWSRLPDGHAVLGPLTVDSTGTALLVALAAALTGLFLSPPAVRALRALDTALARALLAPPRDQQLTRRVEELTESRAQLVRAVDEERRRIERDLHDGAQQRLVALSMALGRAVSRLRKSGDDDTRQIVEQARADARAAIAELRDLARGLHPPVLTDRGLEAALSAVAARSPVPVRLDVRAEPRPPATVEAVAYFVVSEALTNVAKHARARNAWVEIRRAGDRLTVTIGDDGRGGADPAGGSGLSGLAGRVAAVDGRLRVTSPAGGPTLIEVDVQCG